MTRWNVFVGTFTKEFADIFHDLRTNGNSWERSWTGGGTSSSGWKPDKVAYQDTVYSEGVERLVFDDVSGELHHEGTITGDIVNPQYVTTHPSLPVLYASEYSPQGRLLSFALKPDGTCERRSATDTLGRLAIAASVHPSGRCAYVAHFGDGTLSVVHLDDDGAAVSSDIVVKGDRDPDAPNLSLIHI